MNRKLKRLSNYLTFNANEKINLIKILRKRIDFYDKILVLLLNKRMKYSIKIGCIKKTINEPFYSPAREEEILRKICENNAGPLSNYSIEKIFNEILNQSKETQKSKCGK